MYTEGTIFIKPSVSSRLQRTWTRFRNWRFWLTMTTMDISFKYSPNPSRLKQIINTCHISINFTNKTRKKNVSGHVRQTRFGRGGRLPRKFLLNHKIKLHVIFPSKSTIILFGIFFFCSLKFTAIYFKFQFSLPPLPDLIYILAWINEINSYIAIT